MVAEENRRVRGDPVHAVVIGVRGGGARVVDPEKPGEKAAVDDVRRRKRPHGEEENEELLRERQEARAAKDFARSDAARDALAALGVEVRDTPEGPVWDIL